MKKFILVCLLTVSSANAGVYYGVTQSTTTGTAELNLSGKIGVAASSATYTTYTTTIDGTAGINSSKQITASSMTATSMLATNVTASTTTAGALLATTGLVGADANFTDFPRAKFIASQGDTGHTYAFNLGGVGEAVGDSSRSAVGLGGVALLGGTRDVFGTFGRAKIDGSSNTGDAVGVKGASEETHAGGKNVGVYGIASGGANNYSFYGEAGDIYNAGAGVFTSTVSAYMFYANNISRNEGLISTPTITNVGGSSVAVTGTTVLIRDNSYFGSDLYYKTVAANNALLCVADDLNFIYVDWNSGTPIYKATTDRTIFNDSNILPVARVFINASGDLEYILYHGATALGNPSKNYDRVIRIRGTTGIEWESGMALSGGTSRSVQIESGHAWFALRRIAQDTVNSLTNSKTELYVHNAAGQWVSISTRAYENLWYDTPTGTATLTANRYAVTYVFKGIENDEIDFVLGAGDYTLAQAQAAVLTYPDTPDKLRYFYLLVGAIITQKSASSYTSIVGLTQTQLNASPIIDHNDTSNKQGGTTDQYYHLTQAQNNSVATQTFSSMTVTGEVIAGGTLTVNSGFYKTAGAGVGKVLTSDGSGYGTWQAASGGDAILAATQTFSGAQTFTSSVTVGNSGAYSTAMDYSKAVIGSWSVVAISSITAGSSFSFTNYNSSYTCKILLEFTQNTSEGYPYLQFNGDGGNNYNYAIQAYRQDGNRQDEGSNGAQPHMHLLGSGIGIGVGYGYAAELTIMALSPNRTTTKVFGMGGWQYNNSAYDDITFNMSGKWNGQPTSLAITTTAGTMTGRATVLCLIQGAAF